MFSDLTFYAEPRTADPQRVEALARATGFFSAAEVDIARELVEERLQQGEGSGYFFVLAQAQADLVGYTCYGPIPGSTHSHDLYWIVVHPAWQGRGLGRQLLTRTQEAIGAMGGRRVYIETSARSQYQPTQGFYLANGYRQVALLEEFYGPGDGKLIYCKALGGE